MPQLGETINGKEIGYKVKGTSIIGFHLLSLIFLIYGVDFLSHLQSGWGGI